MNENEMSQETERLRRELDEVTKSRDRWIELARAMFNLGPQEDMEKELQDLMNQPSYRIDDIIEDLRREPESPKQGKQIPA